MKSDAIVTALKAAAIAGVDTDDALDQLSDLVELAHAKPTSKLGVVLSEVPLGWHDKTCVVGWDTCASCKQHVSRCKCKNGPTEPGYVTKFRAEKPVTVASTLPTPVTRANPESSLSRSSEEAVSSEGEAQDSLSAQAIQYRKCTICGQDKTDHDGDLNDDGSFTCFTCQESTP